jgi:hypothetical protein
VSNVGKGYFFSKVDIDHPSPPDLSSSEGCLLRDDLLLVNSSRPMAGCVMIWSEEKNTKVHVFYANSCMAKDALLAMVHDCPWSV